MTISEDAIYLLGIHERHTQSDMLGRVSFSVHCRIVIFHLLNTTSLGEIPHQSVMSPTSASPKVLVLAMIPTPWPSLVPMPSISTAGAFIISGNSS